MEIEGVIKRIGDVESRGASGFEFRKLVLETNEGEYSQTIEFTVTGKAMEHGRAGDEVKLHFNIRGREWTNREGKVLVFNDLSVWKIDILRSGTKEHTLPF